MAVSYSKGIKISIHALLAESDSHTKKINPASQTFLSTLSLRRATIISKPNRCTTIPFLSTLSLRRATPRGGFCYLDNIITIHALLAESDFEKFEGVMVTKISIHALLAESDLMLHMAHLTERLFLSTLSLRRATKYHTTDRVTACISIHALLAESDLSSLQRLLISCLFLSTLSLRRATMDALELADAMLFLSTLSLRRATKPSIQVQHLPKSISIHALLAESD